MDIKQYLKQLDQQFRAGNATEHTYRPTLQTLLKDTLESVTVTNEPKQIECGAPDYVLTRNNIPLGYIEAKNIGSSLDDQSHKEQLKRYTESLGNLIFTDYLKFRLFRDGKQASEIAIAEISGGQIIPEPDNFDAFADLLRTFAGYQGQTITTANELAKHMAHKARMLARVIEKALSGEETTDQVREANNTLQNQLSVFRKHLIPTLKALDFADIYAQTIAYGMFAARLHDPTPATFTRKEAAELIPSTNPFLQKFFQHIVGYDLDERIHWIVDDLADVFRAADVGELMKDYGKATQRNDPFLHFYETFLREYSPELRKKRGVYYTPAPVVDFIVRAVDEILRNELGMSRGLADTGKTVIEIDRQVSTSGNQKNNIKKIKKEVHRVQILDPATGTGTFLAAIVKHIHDKHFLNQKGAWPTYVEEDLIPRLNGFEVMMAPYAMAHTKLEMVLRDSGCEPSNDRLRVFLTNSLEEHHPDTDTLFAEWLSTEAKEANIIKRDTPVMIVIGNPPYNIDSPNTGKWITDLIEKYKYVGGKHFEERKHYLHDDYVKFIRFGQLCVDRTGSGVLAYINNHSFLDNPTFRGMRWNLLQSFDKIYIIDLHGNAIKRETAPDGTADKNVFDIRPGVSINLFIKTSKKKKNALAQVFHRDLYGSRENKYQFLWGTNLKQDDFAELKPQAPQYFFMPKDLENKNIWQERFSVPDLFPTKSTGAFTLGDPFAISYSREATIEKIKDFFDRNYSESELKGKYSLGKNYAKWILENKEKINFKEENIVPITYRPFDFRWMVYDSLFIWRLRNKVMQHFFNRKNVGLAVGRQGQVVGDIPWCLLFVTKNITDLNLFYRGGAVVMPLYIYPQTDQQTFDNERHPNLNSDIVKTIADRIALRFVPEPAGDPKTFAPIDLLDYIYAVLHSPTYRERYKEFLKIDFPRVPYPTDKKQFRKLAKLGDELRTLHLFESPELDTLITSYPESGDHIVTKPEYKLTDTKKRLGKVHINDTQYFSDVPEVAWSFHIGGYQPAQKWLKDRKGRKLSPDDITHYQKIIVALTETDRLMQKIDTVFNVSRN